MEKLRSNSVSIWILNATVVLTFWLIIIALVFTGILLILSLAGYDISSFTIQYSFPIHFNIREAGIIQQTGQEVSIMKAGGQIQVGPGEHFFANQLLTSMLIIFALLFLIVGYARKFMKNIKAGNFFIMENMVLLRKVSFTILGLWFVNLLTKIWLTIRVGNLVEFKTVELHYNFDSDIRLLLFPAALLVLSNIFAEGIRLKTAEDLTI